MNHSCVRRFYMQNWPVEERIRSRKSTAISRGWEEQKPPTRESLIGEDNQGKTKIGKKSMRYKTEMEECLSDLVWCFDMDLYAGKCDAEGAAPTVQCTCMCLSAL